MNKKADTVHVTFSDHSGQDLPKI